MGDIVVVDVQPKGIEVTLTIPLESLKKIVKSMDNCEIDLPLKDEANVYFSIEFYSSLQDIIKRIEGEK